MHGEFVGFHIDIHLFLKSEIGLNATQNFGIKKSSDRTEICKISYNFLTVATIWVVMLTNRMWAQKNLRISKWAINY